MYKGKYNYLLHIKKNTIEIVTAPLRKKHVSNILQVSLPNPSEPQATYIHGVHLHSFWN